MHKQIFTLPVLTLLIIFSAILLKPSVAQVHLSEKSFALSPPGCATGDCGLRSSSANPDLVIGILQHVYDENEMQRLYQWGKSTGIWHDFDDDLNDFLTRNRVLLVNAGEKNSSLLLIISSSEYFDAPPVDGDLVRYVPLRPYHDAEGRKAPSRFSVLSGCIAILCRKSDVPCFGNYIDGIFDIRTGLEITRKVDQYNPHRKAVDPITALPVPRANKFN